MRIRIIIVEIYLHTHTEKIMKKEEKTREKERNRYEGGVDTSGADPEIFQRGLRRKILKNVC